MGLLGDPVAHSRSPAMQNAAFAALGLDWVFVAFPSPAGRGRAAVRAVLDLGLAGLNVTMPHKPDAADACDDLSDEAGQLGVVNTVVADHEQGRLTGHNTDGDGFLRALANEAIGVAGARVLVLGAGGAARAIALASGRAGASVTVAARRIDAARDAAALAGGEAVELSDINVGQHDVYETVYPVETPLLVAARERGIGCAGGVGMLVHQGALAFQLWTGREAPLDAMWAAVSTS